MWRKIRNMTIAFLLFANLNADSFLLKTQAHRFRCVEAFNEKTLK